jgi:hypothetical protein
VDATKSRPALRRGVGRLAARVERTRNVRQLQIDD